MEERLKQLRKVLGGDKALSQSKFAKMLGLSQSTIGDIESGRAKLTPRNFSIICEKFNVNPDWLEKGVGEMFMPAPQKTFLDLLAEEKGLNAREVALIQSIIDLPADVRGAVIDWALDLARCIGDENPKEKELRQIEEEQRKLDKRRQELLDGKSFGEESSSKVG